MAAPKGNKYAVGNKGGRPPLFKKPAQLAKKVDEYFKYIEGEWHTEVQKVGRKNIMLQVWDRKPEPATITGLTLFLGFNSRSALSNFDKEEDFMNIILRARARVEMEYEKHLYTSGSNGAQFALKNMGWKDLKSVELGGPDGKAIPIEAKRSNIDYTQLNDEVLIAITNARKRELGQQ